THRVVDAWRWCAFFWQETIERAVDCLLAGLQIGLEIHGTVVAGREGREAKYRVSSMLYPVARSLPVYLDTLRHTVNDRSKSDRHGSADHTRNSVLLIAKRDRDYNN